MNEIERTKTLLSKIRVLRWQLTKFSGDVKEDLRAAGGNSIIPKSVEELFCAAEAHGIELSHTWVNGRLKSAHKTSILLQEANLALKRMETYPDNGKLYADIIEKLYFKGSAKPTVEQLATLIGVSAPTCRKHISNAVNLYTDILWLNPSEARTLDSLFSEVVAA